MTFFNNSLLSCHLYEMRLRLFYLLMSFCFTFLTCYYYSSELFFFYVRPFLIYEKNFIFIDLTEAFYVTLKICFISSFLVFIPCLLYQVWCFFIPSFYYYERRNLVWFGGFMIVLIVVGSLSFYLLLLPYLCKFLLNFEIKSYLVNIELQARISSYINLIYWLFFIAIIFWQIPLLFVIILQLKLVTTQNLSQNRQIIWFVFVILAAFISPPDVVSEIIIAFLLVVFYESMVWFSYYYFKINTKK